MSLSDRKSGRSTEPKTESSATPHLQQNVSSPARSIDSGSETCGCIMPLFYLFEIACLIGTVEALRYCL